MSRTIIRYIRSHFNLKIRRIIPKNCEGMFLRMFKFIPRYDLVCRAQLTFVPQPSNTPSAKAAANPPSVFGEGLYCGINEGASKYTGTILETKPATIGTLSLLGRNMQPETRDEMPKTAPL